MTNLVLVIGTRSISSWSLRPWLALKQSGLPFSERVIELRQTHSKSAIRAVSPSGKLPLLEHGAVKIWESLAICEYVAELACARALWPENRAARAVARAISAEMHAGFAALRQNLPMAVGTRFADFTPSAEARADIERILSLWCDCRQSFGQSGDFLFGQWSLADAMFAPVIFRFQSYGIRLDPVSDAYCQASLSLPAMQEWIDLAASEQS